VTLDDVQTDAQADALGDVTTLIDWRRRVFGLYHEVRADPDPRHAWEHWRTIRDELLTSHPQSPLAPEEQSVYPGAPYFDYDPSYRVTAALVDAEPAEIDIQTSRWSSYRFTRFARAAFELHGRRLSLDCLWLQGYGGGLFLPFGDATNGATSYGAGRYLLDTVKGADLGCADDGELVVDFNFAYNPSCAYSPRWVCPLAPAANRLPAPVEAGERVP